MTSSGAEAAEPVHYQEGAPGGMCGVITQTFEGEMTGDLAEEEGVAVSG